MSSDTAQTKYNLMNEMNTDGNTDLVGEILLNPWQAEDHYQTDYQKYNHLLINVLINL